MSLIKKMFGKKDPVEEIRALHSRKDWAGLLSSIKRLDREALDDETGAEMVDLEQEAGDSLALTNLEEGSWAHKSGNLLRAREDYQLAVELARSTEVRQHAEEALAALDSGAPPAEPVATEGQAVDAGDDSNGSAAEAPLPVAEQTDLDEEARLELLVASMPKQLAERYLAADQRFRQAWLHAQDGDDEQALLTLNQIPEETHDALFFFERGSLMARTGQLQRARQELLTALEKEPELFPALEALVDVLSALGKHDEIENRLKQNLSEGLFAAFCWGHLARLHAQRKEPEPALAAGLKALDEGLVDPNIILLCAQLMERAGQIDEAEQMLMRIQGGGCGGGTHPHLAEFWVRHNRNLNQALEAFKAAMRKDRNNPRWLLGIAKVYLAKGWHKEASEQLETLMRQADLPEQIRAEVNAAAEQLNRR